MLVSLDGGVTYQEAKSGVRIMYDVMVPGEDGTGHLHITATSEGLISDVWVSRESDQDHQDHHAGTECRQIDDIVHELCEAND